MCVVLKRVFFVTAMTRGRAALGLPRVWDRVLFWLRNGIPKGSNKTPIQHTPYVKKYPNIPTLNSYYSLPGEDFWKFFPHKPMPEEIYSGTDHSALKQLILGARNKLTCHQFNRGMRLVEDLQYGASAYQKEPPLPPTDIPNIPSAYEYGMQLTDKIAAWLDAGFVKGPFKYPPIPGFRSNSLMVIPKGENYRPIINMSSPEGGSFNDNLDKSRIEKVKMSIARDFSYTLKDAGKDCRFSKYDFKDAFKNVPARKEDWRLQGFRWLGRYFFETQMIFGATPSVANFDRLSHTVARLAMAEADTPGWVIHRTLDDIPIVEPKDKGYAKDFGKAFKSICEKASIRIAENCPRNEKAFELQTRGTVLGVGFDSKSLTWFLSEEKADKIISSIRDTVEKGTVTRKEMQRTMGLINNLSLMAPFLRFFRSRGNQVLADLKEEDDMISVGEIVKKDLAVCAQVAIAAKHGLPIASRPVGVPLGVWTFYSDAAGAKFAMHYGKRFVCNEKDDRGVAGVLFIEDEPKWFSVLSWPMEFLEKAQDTRGSYYGSKTTLLEVIGVLLPFICIPEELRGKTLLCYVDNMAVVYGWQNGGIRFDESATIMIRAINLLASYLGVTLHVEHVPRRSNIGSVLVDNLSRKTTTTREDRFLLRNARRSAVAGVLLEWLEKPEENWDLPMMFLEELMKKSLEQG
jgi:hypothetical protein